MKKDAEKTLKVGWYPQSKVTDVRLIDRLNAAAGQLPTATKFGNWASYKFYMSGEKSDYMWYVDITLDGNKYRGVYIKRARPFDVSGDSSDFDQRGYQGYFGYRVGKVYWFEFEPIEFLVLDVADGISLVYSRYVLDAMQFDNKGIWEYAAYEDSELRAWLNGEFLHAAFTESERQAFAEFASGDIVSLLSKEEYERFCITGEGWRKDKRLTTDYARCMGVDAESAYGICNFYWLRSVKEDDALGAIFYGVGTLGGIENLCCSSEKMGGGVVPALRVKIG